MITVAVIGILAAIAYPSYTAHIRKGRRATAQTALMDLASKEQTYLLDRRQYSDIATDVGFSTPSEISGLYTFSIVCTPDCISPTTVTMSAAPAGSQNTAGERTLSITNTGVKSPAGVSGYWGR